MTAELAARLAPPQLGGARRPRRRTRIAAVVVALIAVAAGALAVTRPWSGADDTYADDARAVTTLADTQVRLLLQVAAGTAPDDAVERLTAGATGDWRAQVGGGRFTRAVRAGAVDPGTEVSIDSDAVVGVRGEDAEVLVAASSGRRAFLFRVGLTRVDGSWRVATMQAAR
ncbi:hypothetical protein [Nocardioides fonticola]|uniref:hypothetical protein n=1 Tax=Nocardioides fonticola TaxID=450363 RepID=UPI0031D086D5